jgi:hypothetical protein
MEGAILKYCIVHTVDKDFNDHEVGRVFIKDGKVECSPSDDDFLRRLISRTVRRWPYKLDGSPMGVTASEPDVFLESIHRQYQSGYCRVGNVKDDNG